jgi:hypothetical protein
MIKRLSASLSGTTLMSQDFEAAIRYHPRDDQGRTEQHRPELSSRCCFGWHGKKGCCYCPVQKGGAGSRVSFRTPRFTLPSSTRRGKSFRQPLRSFWNTIEKEPKNPEFRLYLGSFYEQIEEYGNAEKAALKEGIALDPEKPAPLFPLGCGL